MVGQPPDAADDLLMAQYHPEAVAFQLLFSWASLKLAQIGGATDSFGMAQLPSNEMLPIAWGWPFTRCWDWPSYLAANGMGLAYLSNEVLLVAS